MDEEAKAITDQQIGKGLEKMEQWEDISDHVRASFKRSMRFLAQALNDHYSGNTTVGNSIYDKGDLTR